MLLQWLLCFTFNFSIKFRLKLIQMKKSFIVNYYFFIAKNDQRSNKKRKRGTFNDTVIVEAGCFRSWMRNLRSWFYSKMDKKYFGSKTVMVLDPTELTECPVDGITGA